MIYRLEGNGTATPFYEVRLSDVGGSWAVTLHSILRGTCT